MSELFSLPLDGIVDFCTMLPFFFLSGFIALRMLRVVRILHLFRINAYPIMTLLCHHLRLEGKEKSAHFLPVYHLCADNGGMKKYAGVL